MDFIIRPVSRKKDIKRFVKSQWNFYNGDPNFVPPLIIDRMKLLNTEKNPFYKHSKLQLFIAESGGEIVGRIAAIVNDNHNITHRDKVGFFGFFECVNDQKVADELLGTAAHWLKEKGMDRIRGPLNPSQNDESGLLVDGFDSPPVTLMTYNPEYYMDLIENAGLNKTKDLFAYILENKNYKSEKLTRLQNLVRKRYNVTIRDLNFKDKNQFKKDVDTLKDIYNEAWEPNWGFVKMTDEEFDFLADDLKQIANPRLAFILESNGEPVGFGLGLPDINQLLIKNKNGGIAKGAWLLLTQMKKIDFFRIIVLGIIPKFHNKGLDAVLYHEFGARGIETGMPDAEASWILEDNEMMNRGLTVTLNGKHYKTYRIYEKVIDY